ncbi:related to aromatic ring-opening dioxygenase LigB subunit, putative [Phialocephala subalpina]|uniref:Related to aromatic ring-opening dioxygenase LigB subunit, putative n=1 Tax=Phialocephala subalpina TaxID=576137 RepID=A0A1L7WGC7_9HELO|nr:related to aromatic ring-opening dioxygenase LigB subunit, putative [Phialocephala subalpina]
MNFVNSRIATIIVTLLVLTIAIILSPASKYLSASRSFAQIFYSGTTRVSTSAKVSSQLISTPLNMTGRTPVYFLSHGGPNIMYEKDHPVYPQLQKIGKEITQKVKPKAIVVFSAHWQGERDVIEINTSETTDLIYDFYGFPAHYYKETFPNKGSPEVALKVIAALTNAGIKTQPLRRGLDHGVFGVFKVAFNEQTNPLNIPIVQVSLYANEDPAKHLALGRALQPLRDESICLIMSGMAVHNLRDLRWGFEGVQPYAKSFDEALREAVESSVEERDGKMIELLKRKDARPAHPSFEHLLPVHIGAGAAGSDLGKRLWTKAEGSFSWAQFRFGEVQSEA